MVNWFSPPLQAKIKYRKGDTLIAVPAKSGTTWTMNIFHQLRTGGDPDFKDIYAEVPWSEFKERPDQPDEELLERWEKMPAEVPRAFKTHSQPGPEGAPMPEMGCFAAYREDLKYVVVMRNPEVTRPAPCSQLHRIPVSSPPPLSSHQRSCTSRTSSDQPVAPEQEAVVSFKPFIESHNPKAFEFFGVPEMREQMVKPSFKAFYEEVSGPHRGARAVPVGTPPDASSHGRG